MAELLTPPPETPPKIKDEWEELVTRLDELLEQYLALLDQYMKAREQASSHLSSGYMSLAQANYHNHTRFGQDYYDERMQATSYVSIEMNDQVPNFTTSKPEPQEAPSKAEPEEPKTSEQTPKDESKTPKAEPSEKAADITTLDEKPSNPSEFSKSRSLDPIRWFGILVPPALRSAQSSFVSAVEGPIPRLATLSKELRNMEIEIGRARKRIRKIEGQ